jgi:hypothetical protein
VTAMEEIRITATAARLAITAGRRCEGAGARWFDAKSLVS